MLEAMNLSIYFFPTINFTHSNSANQPSAYTCYRISNKIVPSEETQTLYHKLCYMDSADSLPRGYMSRCRTHLFS